MRRTFIRSCLCCQWSAQALSKKCLCMHSSTCWRDDSGTHYSSAISLETPITHPYGMVSFKGIPRFIPKTLGHSRLSTSKISVGPNVTPLRPLDIGTTSRTPKDGVCARRRWLDQLFRGQRIRLLQSGPHPSLAFEAYCTRPRRQAVCVCVSFAGTRQNSATAFLRPNLQGTLKQTGPARWCKSRPSIVLVGCHFRRSNQSDLSHLVSLPTFESLLGLSFSSFLEGTLLGANTVDGRNPAPHKKHQSRNDAPKRRRILSTRSRWHIPC